MGQYYFLGASLPFLSYESERPWSPSEFLETLRGQLSDRDLAVVNAAHIEAPEDIANSSPVLTEWLRFDRGLRNQLARLRASELNLDAGEYVRTDEAGRDDTDRSGLSEIAREALTAASPLTGEHALGNARWRFLDDLEVGHYFDVDRLVIYYLKLQLLARRKMFNREDGEQHFVAITGKIMNDYYEEQGTQ